MKALVAACVLVAVAPGAAADPPARARERLNLKVSRSPVPRTLRMRPPERAKRRVAQTGTGTGTGTGAAPDAPIRSGGDVAVAAAARPSDVDVAGIRSTDEKVVFRLDLGFGVDGGQLSGRRGVAGEMLTEADYREVRAQGFGNLFVGTRGLLLAPLSSYLSAGFRVTPSLGQIAPLADALDRTDDVQIRASWAEAANFLPGQLLGPLRVRAGRQYVYGPWPVHLDGTLFGWAARGIRVDIFGGGRVDDYAPTDEPSRFGQQVVGGIIASLDLGVLRKLPFTARASAMQYASRRLADFELGYNPRRGVSAVGGLRWFEGELVRERATLRFRLSEVTHVVLDFEHRQETDWRWDPSFVSSDDLDKDPTAPRRYLELGPVLPQLRGAIRAGTVLFDNLDIYVRGALAIDLGERPDERTGFAEAGFAAEVRARRQVALFASGLIRDYEVTDAKGPGLTTYEQMDLANSPQPLLEIEDRDIRSTMGEEYFIEGGAGIRLSAGARRLSVTAEGYARRNRYAKLYLEPSNSVGDILDLYDTRTGGRFSVDAWLIPRLRIHLEYDLSSQLERAPEITGWKTLRALVEGSF